MSSAVTPPRHEPDQVGTTAGSTGTTADTTATQDRTTAPATDHREVVARQKDRFGGMKFGACFFGWLTAVGTAVLLTALLTAIGLGVGSSQGYTPGQAGDASTTVGLVGGIVLLVVIFIAYCCGGYVAGRMARFNGLRQGVGVWLWSIIAAVVVTVLGLVAGNRFDVLSRTGGLPALPASGSDITTGAIISVIAVIVVALVGAVLGGLSGMRYHRRIDRETFAAETR